MSSKENIWDFECRQYIDFEQGLDDSGKEDIFFDCKDPSPDDGKLPVKGKGLTDSDENKLIGKMTAALSLLENTPKIKKTTPRGKLAEKFASGMCPQVVKSTVKPKTVPAALRKSRKSRSLTNLNTVKTNKTRRYPLRRSSSLNDLPNYKRMKYPVTPMCLKRTIVKAKEKIKTSEERELEEIKKLQRQLILHLRQNEITLRKLNLRPRQGTIPKTVHRCDNLKESKGLNILAEKSVVAEKETRKNPISSNQTALKKETAVLRNSESAANVKMDNPVSSRKSKQPLASTADSDLNKSSIQKTKKSYHSRFLDHSGLIFLPTVKNNFPVKPSFFEAKAKEMKSQLATVKPKEKSVSDALNDKENMPYNVRSTKKTQEIQNAKCDSSTFLKCMKKPATNSLRGLPFAENITRK